MKKLLTLLLSLTSVMTFAQSSDLFSPVKSNTLRMPSVPIIANDPYFCVWSPYDKLYEGSTEYFSSDPKPITGVLRVDGENYRFMGVNLTTIAPLATEENWTAQYLKTQPTGTWMANDYDDSSWNTGKGAFGGGDGAYGNIGTEWSGGNVDIYVRRKVNLDDVNPNGEYYIIYKHDDVFELYLNGEQIASHGNEWNATGITIAIPASKLKKGENIISAHCHNTTGGAYLDFGLFENKMKTAVQNSVDVLATQTYYNFTCGPVNLDLVFTSPMLINDLEKMSFPASFVSYQVKSNDGQEHDVQFYLETSAQLAINGSSQNTVTTRTQALNYAFAKGGNTTQNYLNTTGDRPINWGYVYLFSETNDTKNITIGDHSTVVNTFMNTGNIEPTQSIMTKNGGTYPAMSYIHKLGTVGTSPVSSYVMMAYDDVYSIEYMGSRRKAYWTTLSSRTTFTSKMIKTYQDYTNIMDSCRVLDNKIYDDGYKSGGAKYAELLSGTYRQTMAAHKLVTDADGNLLWMSRENNSGGFINTVDITYPSAPLFLVYNPELVRGMLTPQFDYAATGKWTKGFAAHDLGPYPNANGQTYGGDMPVEESANMIILAAMLQKITGNTDYTNKYLNLLTIWTDYLVANGKDPENQLCTDDFMGHSSRNINLAMKAIMGVLSYAEIAKMIGKQDVADSYVAKAKIMISYWKGMGMTYSVPKHSKLNFGGEVTSWSEKYNMVWDKMLGWNYFENERIADMQFYQTKMLKYGMPLDSRGEYNKNDWHIWVASMTQTDEEFQTYMTPMWNYVNETTTRVPLSDYNDANTGERRGYMARPVVAGYWMKVLMDKFLSGELTSGIKSVSSVDGVLSNECVYNLQGQKLSKPEKGICIVDGKKIIN